MGKIHLNCTATGSITAPDSVDWYFNGEPISEIKSSKWQGRMIQRNSKLSYGRKLISELIIEKVQMEDRGQFVCRLTKTIAEGFKVHVLNGKYLLDRGQIHNLY